ncbi:Carboxylic ester hydrolase [Mycena venus]|uniref:Carboxylic ester hydrolase n=1 Tax=Mycena venus TaxID=2733690 RepID=A0A8H6Y109_9AGAR|nr:Carboxylic ester hydrolase [Mycena venus]
MRGIAFLAAFAFAAVAAQQPTVIIKNGTVRGVDLPQFSQSLFLGIPYAQPPVGDLRLRPPAFYQLVLWNSGCHGLRTALLVPVHNWDDNSGFPNSEDCLTLNVIRPTGVSEQSPVPVVVWIHGGGLTTGGSADFRYNGSWIVQASIANGKPIVFVSINYRLASLGFLAGKALQDEGSLNLGVRDQRLALHWVQENIGKFGGDPNVHAQIIAFAGRDDKLFNQAIAESGTGGGNFSLPTAASFQANFNSLINNTTCVSTANGSEADQLACIRALPIDVFRTNSVGSTGIVFDGDFINVPGTLQAYKDGNWVKVAFIVGSNTDEGRSFSALGANTTEQAAALLSGVPTQFRDPLLALYPDVPALGCPFNTGDFQPAGSPPGSENKRVASVNGDIVMAAGPRWLAQQVSSQVPFYKYRFNHVPYNTGFAPIDYVSHFLEVSYVFNLQNNDTAFWITNHFTATYLGPTAPIADRFLGTYMSRTWASFIATGDPNNANVPSKVHWPKYSEEPSNMVWQTQGSTVEEDNFRQEGMQFIMDHIFFQ